MKDVCSLHEGEINRALRLLGGVEPRYGFETRLIAHLDTELDAAAAPQTFWTQTLWTQAFWTRARLLLLKPHVLAPRFALGAVAAGLAGVAVLVATAIHNRALVPPASGPIQHLPASSAFGGASAARLPAQAIHGAHASSRGRAQAHSRHGRAILPQAPSHATHGSVKPPSPYAGDSLPVAGPR